jgi:hypothetical protein
MSCSYELQSERAYQSTKAPNKCPPCSTLRATCRAPTSGPKPPSRTMPEAEASVVGVSSVLLKHVSLALVASGQAPPRTAPCVQALAHAQVSKLRRPTLQTQRLCVCFLAAASGRTQCTSETMPESARPSARQLGSTLGPPWDPRPCAVFPRVPCNMVAFKPANSSA